MNYTIKGFNDLLWKQFKSKLAMEEKRTTILAAFHKFVEMYVNNQIKL